MAAEQPVEPRAAAEAAAREADALTDAARRLEGKAARQKEQLDATKADIKRFREEAKAARARAKSVADGAGDPDAAVGARAENPTVKVEED